MHDRVYRFCPVCASALEPRLVRTGKPERPACPACDYIYIPWDALAFQSTRDALRDYLDGLRHPVR